MTESANRPFIKYRECTLSDPWGLYHIRPRLKDEHRQRYCIERWPLAQLEAYVDMLNAFGYNSIQIHDLWENYKMGKLADPQTWRKKVLHVFKYARQLGMRTTLFVWGNSPYDYRDGRHYRNANWYDPKQREILERYHDYQAAEYAPHIDHVLTHWGDPGGCLEGPNTIETAQEIHNAIVGKFKAKNQKVEDSFSLWALNSDDYGKWKGYKDETTILDSGILPQETMLALGARYHDRAAKAIVNAGRKVGVWIWYLADHEIRPSLHVHHRRIGQYFNNLPSGAGDLLEWHSMESNSHTLNVWNLYVAAQLMINPKLDADDLLCEFVEKAFGKENREGVLNALNAIAFTRCVKDYDYGFVEKVFDGIPNIPAYSVPVGENHPDTDLGMLKEALKGLEKVSIRNLHTPEFPMVISPQALVQEIGVHLQSMVSLAHFRKAVLEGAEDFPEVPVPNESITHIESNYYHFEMERLGRQVLV